MLLGATTKLEAVCFFGNLDEFVRRAEEENKPYYAAVVKAAVEAAEAVMRGGEDKTEILA